MHASEYLIACACEMCSARDRLLKPKRRPREERNRIAKGSPKQENEKWMRKYTLSSGFIKFFGSAFFAANSWAPHVYVSTFLILPHELNASHNAHLLKLRKRDQWYKAKFDIKMDIKDACSTQTNWNKTLDEFTQSIDQYQHTCNPNSGIRFIRTCNKFMVLIKEASTHKVFWSVWSLCVRLREWKAIYFYGNIFLFAQTMTFHDTIYAIKVKNKRGLNRVWIAALTLFDCRLNWL